VASALAIGLATGIRNGTASTDAMVEPARQDPLPPFVVTVLELGR
jgi:hypothetical protein